LRENELDEAQENFRLALEAAPNRPETLLSLGQIAELKGEWESAKIHYANFLRTGAEPKLKAQISDRLRRIDGRAPKAGGAA
jgi:Tfp pilus assembly protein PilF